MPSNPFTLDDDVSQNRHQGCILNIMLLYLMYMALIKNVKYSADFILSIEYQNEEDAIKNVNGQKIEVKDINNIRFLKALTKKGETDGTHAKGVSVTESIK